MGVVGGKLTFLPGATVEGAEGLFDVPSGAGAVQLPYLEDSKATSAASLREDYNKLLAALRTAARIHLFHLQQSAGRRVADAGN